MGSIEVDPIVIESIVVGSVFVGCVVVGSGTIVLFVGFVVV